MENELSTQKKKGDVFSLDLFNFYSEAILRKQKSSKICRWPSAGKGHRQENTTEYSKGKWEREKKKMKHQL